MPGSGIIIYKAGFSFLHYFPIFSCESNSYNWVLCRPAAGLPAWTNLHYSSPLGTTRG